MKLFEVNDASASKQAKYLHFRTKRNELLNEPPIINDIKLNERINTLPRASATTQARPSKNCYKFAVAHKIRASK